MRLLSLQFNSYLGQLCPEVEQLAESMLAQTVRQFCSFAVQDTIAKVIPSTKNPNRAANQLSQPDRNI